MTFPQFFAAVPTITLRDPLAEFLGTTDAGIIEYAYQDVVKLAGHSCPTVACTYWITRQALRALYGADTPERGAIRVEFREDASTGVIGVIANVVSMLTGATLDSGFKGLAGRYDRRQLMAFNANIPLEMRFTRIDTASAVDVACHPRNVPADPEIPPLMQLGLKDAASAEQRQRFARLWQERVKRLLTEHLDDPAVFELRAVLNQGQAAATQQA